MHLFHYRVCISIPHTYSQRPIQLKADSQRGSLGRFGCLVEVLGHGVLRGSEFLPCVLAIRLTVLLQHVCPTLVMPKVQEQQSQLWAWQVISGICFSSRKLTNPKVSNSKATTAVPVLLFYSHTDVLQSHRHNWHSTNYFMLVLTEHNIWDLYWCKHQNKNKTKNPT